MFKHGLGPGEIHGLPAWLSSAVSMAEVSESDLERKLSDLPALSRVDG